MSPSPTLFLLHSVFFFLNPSQPHFYLSKFISILFFCASTGYGKQLSEDDIDFTLVKKFLKGIGSQLLVDQDDKQAIYFYERLNLVRQIGDKRVGEMLVPVWAPRNVALLFFHPVPHVFFTGAKTEIAIYTHDDDVTEEETITGPIDQQIAETLSFILKTTKEEARHEFAAYPTRALREAVVNAFHHRGYEECDSNPIKIHIKPNCIDVISYPGPDPTLTPEDFSEGKGVPYVPCRNRRIAEFLKERKLAEGRLTGVSTIYRTMKKNNNPKPSFHFNPSYFCVRLPGHPKYLAYSILREVDNLCAKGDKLKAIKYLTGFLDEHVLAEEHSFLGSEMLISKLLELHRNDTSHPNLQPYKHLIPERLQRRIVLVTKLGKWCNTEEGQDISTGVMIVKRLVEEGAGYEDLHLVVTKAVDLCRKRGPDGQLVLSALQNAHKLFEAMGEVTQRYGYVAYHFACCKFNLYKMTVQGMRQREDFVHLLTEAEHYIRRAIQLTDENHRHHLANQYCQLGYIHSELLVIKKSTAEQVVSYYQKALRYNPFIEINEESIPPEYLSQFMSSVISLRADGLFKLTASLPIPDWQIAAIAAIGTAAIPFPARQRSLLRKMLEEYFRTTTLNDEL